MSQSQTLDINFQELTTENRRLRDALTESEKRIAELQNGVLELHDEYRSESAELAERVERLAKDVEEEHLEKADLKRNLEKAIRAKKVERSWRFFPYDEVQLHLISESRSVLRDASLKRGIGLGKAEVTNQGGGSSAT